MRAVRLMGRGHSDRHVVLCKVKLVRASINRRRVVGTRKIKSEKMKENQHTEGYARSLVRKRVE